MIIGQFVELRAIYEGDLITLMAWRNNPDFRKNYREYRELSLPQQEEWFRQMLKDSSTLMFSIIDPAEERWVKRLIGCCGLTNINWVSRTAEISLYIGKDNLYLDNHYAPDAWKTLMHYGFDELGMNKLWVEAYEFDTRRIFLCDSLGFHRDGCLRQNTFKAGGYWDSLIFSLLREEWKGENDKERYMKNTQ